MMYKATTVFMLDENGIGVRGLDHEFFVCTNWTKRLNAVRTNCWYVLELQEPMVRAPWVETIQMRKNHGGIEAYQDHAWRSLYPMMSQWLLEKFEWNDNQARTFVVSCNELKGSVR